MSKMTKRLLAVTLTVGMLSSTAAGFAFAEEETDPAYAPMEETVTIHIGRSEDANASYLSGQDSLNNYVNDYIRESLNVEFVYDFSVASDYETKVSMAIASGSMPDVMIVTASQLRELQMAGAVEDLTDAYEAYASDNLKAAYDSTEGASFSNATFDGRLMAMPSISPGADAIPMLFVRGDWMDELGLEAPTSVDDIVAIVNAFKENKNENSSLVVSQTITSESGNNTYGIDALFASYGAYPKHWITDADGNLVYGSNTPEAKTALQEIRKLVESGVIDSSFTVRDSDQCAELVTSGQSGIFFGAWWNMSWPLNNMVEEDSSIYWNAYLAPLTEDGIYNTATLNPSNSFLVIKAGASEEVIEAVIKVMNYQFDIDQDQAVSLKASPEDPYSWTEMPLSILLSTYTDKEDKAEAVLKAASGEIAAEELSGEAAQWYESYVAATEDVEAAASANNLSGWAYVRGCQPLVENADNMNKVFDATYAKTDSMDSKWATLEKLEDEFYLKYLNGEATDEDFDSYVEQWNSLGGTDITAELVELMGE
ncbi:MAG: extracellular solute-binding protein [Eubacteriales bacterium]|nr:extracellular solute-binding protein [Eubacteriales bacterium]